MVTVVRYIWTLYKASAACLCYPECMFTNPQFSSAHRF